MRSSSPLRTSCTSKPGDGNEAKRAEYGGFSRDDRDAPLAVWSAGFAAASSRCRFRCNRWRGAREGATPPGFDAVTRPRQRRPDDLFVKSFNSFVEYELQRLRFSERLEQCRILGPQQRVPSRGFQREKPIACIDTTLTTIGPAKNDAYATCERTFGAVSSAPTFADARAKHVPIASEIATTIGPLASVGDSRFARASLPGVCKRNAKVPAYP